MNCGWSSLPSASATARQRVPPVSTAHSERPQEENDFVKERHRHFRTMGGGDDGRNLEGNRHDRRQTHGHAAGSACLP